MSQTILIIGAGKSATVLIQYLQQKAVENDWYILLADGDEAIAKNKWNNAPNGTALGIDIENNLDRQNLVQKADIVVSMMPAQLHFLVAKDCLQFGKPLFTASYVDDNMRSIASEIEAKQLLFLCEMGLDPGIDHMSAMAIIDEIHQKGGKITSFKSHCGGLVAPESDDNPWHYKISWNPRNIILAGKAGAIYLENGATISKDYSTIFEQAPVVDLPGIGHLAFYPNRNSLSYIDTYHLHGIKDFVRTTLRYPAFCIGWNAIVQLHLTDETVVDLAPNTTVKNWFESHIQQKGLEQILEKFTQDPAIKVQLEFIGLYEPTPIPSQFNSNASILQWLLEGKWKLTATDKDLVVMLHEIEYSIGTRQFKLDSSMVLTGEDAINTAMATTVGLPLAMGVCAYLKGEIKMTGLHIPIDARIYQPILKSLAEEGIVFEETLTSY
ncbi:MAG: saccharopine dehydrogenase NADP-binding domain-containing protein [Chitinophagaceae bacterium]|nr:saccharopine dehydrogenase NADP-binding domain-containing protein [Chitinophagaceae bacterium]MCF8422428.1 saccharopine dehydrogenase NADP-binding domain-containing protein [Chitinophagaceae bacterium]